MAISLKMGKEFSTYVGLADTEARPTVQSGQLCSCWFNDAFVAAAATARCSLRNAAFGVLTFGFAADGVIQALVGKV